MPIISRPQSFIFPVSSSCEDSTQTQGRTAGYELKTCDRLLHVAGPSSSSSNRDATTAPAASHVVRNQGYSFAVAGPALLIGW